MAATPVMTFARMDALCHIAQVDSANKYQRSERGFNTHMRVSSNGRSTAKRWTPGMSVGWQRVTTSGDAYKLALRKQERDGAKASKNETVWKDIGSTFAMQSHARKDRMEHTTNHDHGGPSVAWRVFGQELAEPKPTPTPEPMLARHRMGVFTDAEYAQLIVDGAIAR